MEVGKEGEVGEVKEGIYEGQEINEFDENMPYNLKSYQQRLLQLLRRIQQFGVDSSLYLKKPYVYSGQWMEHVKSLDDLML